MKKSRRNILRAIIVEWRSYALQINLAESTAIDSLSESIPPISSDYSPELHRYIRPVLGEILLLDFFNRLGQKRTVKIFCENQAFPAQGSSLRLLDGIDSVDTSAQHWN